jgi:REP element-mobilizing transposase RayT
MTQTTLLLPNCYYHIYNRGNNGGDIFFEERNYSYFFKLYLQHIFPIAKTYAYCLMRNHFHLLVSMRPMVLLNPSGLKDLKGFDKQYNYSQSFSNFFNAYTKAINKSYQRTGSVFEKPFQRLLVDSDSYFVQLVSYIHRNPQKHGFVSDFRNYPYSSYSAIRFQKRSRVETQTTLSWFGNLQSYEFCHLQNDDKSIQHFVADD